MSEDQEIPVSDRLRSTALGRGGSFTASEMQELVPEASRELVDQMLSRLVRSGELQRQSRGVYTAARLTESPDEKWRAQRQEVRAADAVSLIWDIAELLRGDYRPADYKTVILPFTVLRRLDCVLEKAKPAILKAAQGIGDLETLRIDQELPLTRAAGYPFYNVSPMTMTTAASDPDRVRQNLEAYVAGFSPNVRDIFDRYKFDVCIDQLDEKNLLYKVAKRFIDVDLHVDAVPSVQMGLAFEHLIRKFAELSNEFAGDYLTPRDAIRLMVDLLLAGDTDLLVNKAPLRSVYDPAAGTGGMLSIAEDRIKDYSANAKVTAYAQELNDESYAICKADMLIKGQNVDNVLQGNTLSDDRFPNKTFNLMFSNPPYGVDWKKIQEDIEDEHKYKGHDGRYGAGLPRISDGSLLFVSHLISKMEPPGKDSNGSRIAIVMNGSPLFSGGVGSGESEIRKFLFENDLVEAIVALPTDMFYNTGIATYIWILSNNKAPQRQGLTQLIDATSFSQKLRKSLGNKRRELSESDISSIVQIYGDFEETDKSRIFKKEDFGYYSVVIERPLRLRFEITEDGIEELRDDPAFKELGTAFEGVRKVLNSLTGTDFGNRKAFEGALERAFRGTSIRLRPPQTKAINQKFGIRDESAPPSRNQRGKLEPDPELRDTEQIPLSQDIQEYFEREVLPHVPDAWIDHTRTRIGYEIPFARHFFKYDAPRTTEQIDADLRIVTQDIIKMIQGTAV